MSTTTATLADVTLAGRYEPPRLPSGPILAASDGSPTSDAALAMAQLLAVHAKAAVEVVSVLHPFASSMYAYDLVPIPLENDESVRQHRLDDLRAQLARTTTAASRVDATSWPVTVQIGDPPKLLTERAHKTCARVLVTGRGRHHLLGRMLGGELVLRLLQMGDIPVFAVEPTLSHLPRRVVIAIDFSEQSVFAARVGLSLVSPDAEVTLVHVAPRAREWDEAVRIASEAYQLRALERLSILRDVLRRGELRFTTRVVEGQPADAMMTLARQSNAELIVTATHGYGFIRRAVLGSVASSLVRNAPCSVLCVPGAAQSTAASLQQRVSSGETCDVHSEVLDETLQLFTRRNAHRLCTLEANDPLRGPQALGHALPLLMVTGERMVDEVTVTFGTSERRGEHMSYVLREATTVEIGRDAEGHDISLRIRYRDGSALLELE